MTTKRQQFWINAAEKGVERNNELTATLFWLIAQPNDQEQADDRQTTGDTGNDH